MRRLLSLTSPRSPRPRARLGLALGLITALCASPALAESGDPHPYDAIGRSERPDVYGDMIAGWRSSTTSVVDAGPLGLRAPSAWGVLFGMRADLYSGKRDEISGRSTIDVAGGGGTWGDWRAVLDLTVGKRLELGGNSGLVLRGGTHLHSVGAYGTEAKANARARDARIDLPVIELAYQRTHGLGLFEVGVRNALTLYGFYAPGDASRTFSLKPGVGAYLAWHHDDLHLELEATQASLASKPVTFVNGILCSTASMLALCGEARYVVGAVESRGPASELGQLGQRTIASWHVGATVGVGFDFATLK